MLKILFSLQATLPVTYLLFEIGDLNYLCFNYFFCFLKNHSIINICRNHFDWGKPCLGCLDERDNKEEYLSSYTPVPRRVSKVCHRMINDSGENTISCEECQKLKITNSGEQIDRLNAVKRKAKLVHEGNDIEEKKARMRHDVRETLPEQSSGQDLSSEEAASCDFTFNDDFVSKEEEVVIGRDETQ